MAIFEKNERHYFRVLTSVAGSWGSLQMGEILETTGAVPAALRAFVDRGMVAPLPDPGEPGAFAAWLPALVPNIRPIAAKSFQSPSEPPAERYLDEPAVLARMDWTADQLQTAIARLGFPKHRKTREKYIENHGFDIVGRLWAQDAVERWEREVPRDLLVGAGR